MKHKSIAQKDNKKNKISEIMNEIMKIILLFHVRIPL
jgi:hypothetical protein